MCRPDGARTLDRAEAPIAAATAVGATRAVLPLWSRDATVNTHTSRWTVGPATVR